MFLNGRIPKCSMSNNFICINFLLPVKEKNWYHKRPWRLFSKDWNLAMQHLYVICYYLRAL